jgi:hypothetical protein
MLAPAGGYFSKEQRMKAASTSVHHSYLASNSYLTIILRPTKNDKKEAKQRIQLQPWLVLRRAY